MNRVWIDIFDHRQARLLAYLAKALSNWNETIITSSENSQTQAVLKYEQVKFDPVDYPSSDVLGHYGKRVRLLSEKISKDKPDLLVCDLDPAAVRTAFGLGIPIWTYFRKPRNSHDLDLERMSYPLCDKVFASSFHRDDELRSTGISSDNIYRFHGWNECYLKNHTNGPISNHSKVDPKVMIRSYGDGTDWMYKLLSGIFKEYPDVKVTILGEGNPDLSRRFASLQITQFKPELPPLGQDLFLGWGRLLAESYVLGVPTVGIDKNRHEDLSVLYNNIHCGRDPNALAQASVDMLGTQARERFRLDNKAIISSLESPVECLIADM